MNCRLTKIEELSGKKASIYSIIIEDQELNLLEIFLEGHSSKFKNETIDILKRLNSIGNAVGAAEHLFKLGEGKSGDGVCALYDMPNSNLRLYCLRFGNGIVIVGSGGHKPKSIRRLQESETLKETNYMLRSIDSRMAELIKSKELRFASNEIDFEGEFEFEIDI